MVSDPSEKVRPDTGRHRRDEADHEVPHVYDLQADEFIPVDEVERIANDRLTQELPYGAPGDELLRALYTANTGVSVAEVAAYLLDTVRPLPAHLTDVLAMIETLDSEEVFDLHSMEVKSIDDLPEPGTEMTNWNRRLSRWYQNRADMLETIETLDSEEVFDLNSMEVKSIDDLPDPKGVRDQERRIDYLRIKLRYMLIRHKMEM